jgi:hypothetical protein
MSKRIHRRRHEYRLIARKRKWLEKIYNPIYASTPTTPYIDTFGTTTTSSTNYTLTSTSDSTAYWTYSISTSDTTAF